MPGEIIYKRLRHLASAAVVSTDKQYSDFIHRSDIPSLTLN